METNRLIEKYLKQIMVDYPEEDKIYLDLTHFVNEVQPVSKLFPICNIERCEKWQSLVKHKANLITENEQLRQRLIDAGLEKTAIRIDVSRKA